MNTRIVTKHTLPMWIIEYGGREFHVQAVDADKALVEVKKILVREDESKWVVDIG